MIDMSPRVSPRTKGAARKYDVEAKMEPDYANRDRGAAKPAERSRGLTAMALNFVGVNRVKKQRFSQMLTRQSKVGGIRRQAKYNEDEQISGFKDLDLGKKTKKKKNTRRQKMAMHFGGYENFPAQSHRYFPVINPEGMWFTVWEKPMRLQVRPS